jgi:hypothetical protein
MGTKSARLNDLQALRNQLSPEQPRPKAAESLAKADPPADVAKLAPTGPIGWHDEPEISGQPVDDIGALMREAAAYFEERTGDNRRESFGDRDRGARDRLDHRADGAAEIRRRTMIDDPVRDFQVLWKADRSSGAYG